MFTHWRIFMMLHVHIVVAAANKHLCVGARTTLQYISESNCANVGQPKAPTEQMGTGSLAHLELQAPRRRI